MLVLRSSRAAAAEVDLRLLLLVDAVKFLLIFVSLLIIVFFLFILLLHLILHFVLSLLLVLFIINMSVVAVINDLRVLLLLDHDLLNIGLYLRGQQLSQLLSQRMLHAELLRQL